MLPSQLSGLLFLQILFGVCQTIGQQSLRAQDILLYAEQDRQAKTIITSITKVQLVPKQNLVGESESVTESKTIYLTFKTLSGQVQAYLAPENGYPLAPEDARDSQTESGQSAAQQNEGQQAFNLQQRRTNEQWKNSQLKIEDGLNIIDMQKLFSILAFGETSQQNKEIPKAINFVLVIIPTLESQVASEVIMKIGEPRHGIQLLNVGRNVIVELQGHTIHGKVYKIETEEAFGARFIRQEGFPSVTVISCTSDNHNECIYSPRRIPGTEMQERAAPAFNIERMMTAEEQYEGKMCLGCHFYILVQSYQGSINLTISVKKVHTAIELKQNQVKQEYLPAGVTKEYAIWVKYNEVGFASIKVYEGEIQARILDHASGFEYLPAQHSGVIPIEIPIADAQQLEGIRQVQLMVTGLQKDAAFSVLYSSGDYEVYLRDGETISQGIKPNQTIKYYYLNQELGKQAMYFSLSVDDPTALRKLKLQVYYYQEIEGLLLSSEYIPSKPFLELDGAKSMVLEIPGSYPKFMFKFTNEWQEEINLDMAINDQEIILLPLYYSLPLQIDKDESVNLLVKNNQEGFIELLIKKCDDSNPTLAYSLDSSDFLNQIYDYESVGEAERITRNSIKVKKGKGLYVRIDGDSISNSFIQVSARYMELGRKKFEVTRLQKGDHGIIKYQLLTDSKAQITFTGLECADECRDSTSYQCVWSTSRADLYRQLVCPNSFVIGSVKSNDHTGAYNIPIKPAHSDNQVSFKHELGDNILYMSIKATHVPSKTEFYYKDIEIVTIEGQLSRLSEDFKKKILLFGICAVVGIYIWASTRRRPGYQPLNAQRAQQPPTQQPHQ